MMLDEAVDNMTDGVPQCLGQSAGSMKGSVMEQENQTPTDDSVITTGYHLRT